MSQPKPPEFHLPPEISHHVLGAGLQAPPMMMTETMATKTVSGPIPSPEVIAGYEKVLTGSADRIIKMAEKEQDHRHRLQGRAQSHVAILTFVGQLFAFLMGISGIAGGVYLVANNKPITGFGVFFTSLATLLGLFFYARNQEKPPPKSSPADKS